MFITAQSTIPLSHHLLGSPRLLLPTSYTELLCYLITAHLNVIYVHLTSILCSSCGSLLSLLKGHSLTLHIQFGTSYPLTSDFPIPSQPLNTVWAMPEQWRRHREQLCSTWLKNITDNLIIFDMRLQEAREPPHNLSFWRLLASCSATYACLY